MSSSVALRKSLGAYYTPDDVATTLVKWSVRRDTDRLLDPACGDGQFLAEHVHSFGVERDATAASLAASRAPNATIFVGDFFEWANETTARFECAAGNPPFIRYQRFAGEDRERALSLCRRLGVRFSALTSSWAPFLVAAASLLKPGGRLAFVVPAEIGHAPYAVPVIEYLTSHFDKLCIVAVREKVFADLSEDVWLLYAEGFGGSTEHVVFRADQGFVPRPAPPRDGQIISLRDWSRWNHRLRPFILPAAAREVYDDIRDSAQCVRMRDVARVGIGYVTGANDFFHLRPSQARFWGISEQYLLPAVRNSRCLAGEVLTPSTVSTWKKRDDPFLLLHLNAEQALPQPVQDYLDSPAGRLARKTFKCRNRRPWYVVPDVRTPDAFLSYMSGVGPQLVANAAGCTCTNSLHAVELVDGWNLSDLRSMWEHPLTRLSCEIEGHPLGGGMLKIEPGEGARIVLLRADFKRSHDAVAAIEDGIVTARRWRHYE
jgi:adenine-specific DNA-methyltransferase